jgi:AraC family transcriptional regulator of adaptative response/methylated-DNA-[protein]-cysteine methyltransferase
MKTISRAAVESNRQRFITDRARWLAVGRKDQRADGLFWFAVKTTGVYCRPSCAARLAKRQSVSFFDSTADAEKAGFRACKRCDPKGNGWPAVTLRLSQKRVRSSKKLKNSRI